MQEVYVSGLAFDSLFKAPVVLLREIEGERVLPIWIGPNEAAVIALELSGVAPKRPLTHDLLKSVLDGFDATLQKIVVSAIRDNTYFAKFYIKVSERSIIEIDARPSDSVAMALKMDAPIFISDDLEDSLVTLTPSEDDAPDQDEPDSPAGLRRRLRNINPEDFGNFDQ